jgi:hypothetical protein
LQRNTEFVQARVKAGEAEPARRRRGLAFPQNRRVAPDMRTLSAGSTKTSGILRAKRKAARRCSRCRAMLGQYSGGWMTTKHPQESA